VPENPEKTKETEDPKRAEDAKPAPTEAEAAGAAEAEGDEDEAPEDAEEEDGATPEAIARRVAAFGEEDEAERIAREEEQKLAERRAKARGKKGKKGLEAAASKRLAKIAEKAQPKKMVATAVDGADPLLKQTARLSTWVKKNQTAVGTIVLVALAALGGLAGYNHFQHKKEADASADLAKAVADEHGRIGDPDKDDDTNGIKDPRPVFKTAEARRDAALKKFQGVESKYPGTGAAILARLSEGSLQLDARNADAAIAAFEEVKGSPLAAVDAEVRGRAVEGLGFAYELKGNQDEALKTFRELENAVDVVGFKELGMYHQARVYEAKGDKDKAKELLKTLHDRLNKPGDNFPFPYLKDVADDRLRALDPSAVPPKPSIGGPGGNKMDQQQLQKLFEQMKMKGGKMGDEH
jgi:hypothetical protein